MIKRCSIEDIKEVHSILKHKDIYSRIIDDGSPPVEQFSAASMLLNPMAQVIISHGVLFTIFPVNAITWDLHIHATKKKRGEIAMKALNEVIEYMFTKTPCQKLVAFISKRHMNVAKFAHKAGWDLEGEITGSMKIDGKIYDQYIFGLRREQWQ